MSIKNYVDAAGAASTKPSKAVTSQMAPIPGREADMARNNAGGFTFVLDDWGVLDRFIMLGTEGGGYYVGEKDLTKQSFAVVKKCLAADAARTINRVVEYSDSGRAPKNDPALVVLALAASSTNPEVQALAWAALPKVARIGTHLFTFMAIFNSLGKWNAAAKRGVANWYNSRSLDAQAMQMLKYANRNGWTQRDVLRLAHVKPTSPAQANLFKYVTAGGDALSKGDQVPQLVIDYEYLKMASSAADVLSILKNNTSIPWELIPTQFMKDKDVMMHLLPHMKMTALIRQLGRLSAIGLGTGDAEKIIISKLTDTEAIKGQRVHPITLLQASKQYAMGRGEKGSLTWSASRKIIDALDDAFYASFSNVKDTGAGYMLAVDVSGSMTWDSSKVNGSPNLVARDVAGCMALAIAKAQSNYMITAFSGQNEVQELKINPSMRMSDVLKVMSNLPARSTDCAGPMVYAKKRNLNGVDLFTVITDNETYAGHIHPTQALRDYRNAFVPTAKLAVIATSVSQFTIADPKDAGMMDIAGFDSAAPQILADFAMLGRR